MIRTAASLGVVLAVVLVAMAGPSQAAELTLKVTAQADGTNVPVSTALPKGAAEGAIFRMSRQGKKDANLLGQILAGDDGPELHWVVPQVSRGQAVTWTAAPVASAAGAKTFTITDTALSHTDILFDGRIVTRYMCADDTSTPAKAHETYKVYNHVFDAAGKGPITKGAGGKFTHHRGIFIGWNKTSAGKRKADTWHMKGCRHKHQKLLTQSAGPAAARTVALIHWNDTAGKPLLIEQRQVTVYAQPAPAIMLMDFRSTFTTPEDVVTLAGDPEHAGCQYRPHNDVAANKGDKATKYLFYKDSITGKGQFEKDMPWACMSYSLAGQRYNVQHMSHPTIPRGNAYSAYRDYGRFGAYCTTKVVPGKPLQLRYRYYVGTGEMPQRTLAAARYAAFAAAPTVQIVK